MRCDQTPFSDPRVRRAIALTLDRPAIIASLFKGLADVGNDSPFAPVFPETNTSIAQRTKNLTEAKALLSAAGHGSGFSTQLYANGIQEIPDYAQIVQQSAKAIGVNITVHAQPSAEYYGKGTFGNSNWLDATMSLVDYGHRGVPNAFLGAPLETITKAGTGAWNAAHFNNSQYDKLAAQYIAAVDLAAERQVAGQIETLLQTETPVIYGYFYNYLSAWAKNVSGVYPTAIGHLFLYNATKT
jgi:peptide/nickel transport system substrate-binding protein